MGKKWLIWLVPGNKTNWPSYHQIEMCFEQQHIRKKPLIKWKKQQHNHQRMYTLKKFGKTYWTRRGKNPTKSLWCGRRGTVILGEILNISFHPKSPWLLAIVTNLYKTSRLMLIVNTRPINPITRHCNKIFCITILTESYFRKLTHVISLLSWPLASINILIVLTT